MHSLPLVMKMNEEEERAILENFVDSSILERLFNETEDEKYIIHMINMESHTLLCKFGVNLISEPHLHYYFHPLLVQLSPNALKSMRFPIQIRIYHVPFKYNIMEANWFISSLYFISLHHLI